MHEITRCAFLWFFLWISHPKRLLEPAVIGDILPLSHPSVYVLVDLLYLVPGVLVDDALCLLAKRPNSRVVPPLHHVAVLVELPAFVVEAVGYLVAYYNADAAVIQRLGEVLRVEQRLEDTRRKDCRTEFLFYFLFFLR